MDSPRLPGGEVEAPAYRALREGGETGAEMFEALPKGVSTGDYAGAIAGMAESVGASRPAVSREASEAGERMLKHLLERRWDEVDLLAICLDGMRFGAHRRIDAVGVDRAGGKYVLGVRLGATENAAAVEALPVRLREQGLRTERRYLFAIDGAKALRAGIDEVFGPEQSFLAVRQALVKLEVEMADGLTARMRNKVRFQS